MKFGLVYHTYQVAEWGDLYIRYDTAKRLIKKALRATEHTASDASLQEFFHVLTCDIDKVSDFYDTCQSQLLQRCSSLGLHTPRSLQPDSELVATCERLTTNLSRLLWYGRVNAEAYTSLINKASRLATNLDIPILKDQKARLELSFITQVDSLAAFRSLRCWLDNHSVDTSLCLSTFADDHRSNASIEQNDNVILHSAIRTHNHGRVKALIVQKVDPFLPNSLGETCLYGAARIGDLQCIKSLLRSYTWSKNDIDMAEMQNGWTPLIVACVYGHLDVVVLLVEEGAEITLEDKRGWTSTEHAAFRGHLEVAAWLSRFVQSRNSTYSSINKTVNIDPGYQYGKQTYPMSLAASAVKSGCTNRVLCANGEAKSYVIIRLGPGNTRVESTPMQLLTPASSWESGQCSLMHYALLIHITGQPESKKLVKLPLLKDLVNEPIVFEVSEPQKSALTFTLRRVENMETAEGAPIGIGHVVLKALKQGFAPNFESLMRDYQVPILAKDSLELFATVTFNYLLTTPVKKTYVHPAATKGFWGNTDRVHIVGHRGSGMNTPARTNLQLGENTIQSMVSAAHLGASGVEFDVQLTKDLVPIIYHDFTVIEQGGDTPIHALQASQFMSLSRTQSPRGNLSSSAETRYLERNKAEPTKTPLSRPRSQSINDFDDIRALDIYEKMRMTAEGLHAPLKGNVRGLSIQDNLPAFQELLQKVPESVAFDVEFKYPMLWEAEDRNMAPFAVEVNAFVDRVLEQIYLFGGRRSIGFSSFSPEICILLASKQEDYPILFLSKSGSIPVGDVRSSGIQHSVQFAKRWGLAGIVMLSEPFVMCPRLISFAKAANLICCSYGNLNDEPEKAVIQANAGLDVIIVNRVRLISQTVGTESQGSKEL